MNNKALTLSIVIPVYNEEHHIKACLDAVAQQTVMPDEVIVVDNNSTDDTIKIAKQYDFVRVVREKNQGRGFATATGLSSARSDIIGRIDADSVLMKGWVARVKNDFAEQRIDAVTGLARANLLPRIRSVHATLWPRAYYWHVHAQFRACTAWGANMAVSRKAWLQIKDDVCRDDSIVHDDEDISLLLLSKGGKIIKDNALLVTNHKQSYGYLPKFLHYLRLAKRTKQYHRERGTFNAPQMKRLSYWHVLWGGLVTIFLGLPFLLMVICIYPLDLIVLGLGKDSRTWLD